MNQEDLVIVGERSETPRVPALTGDSARRLASLAGVDLDSILAVRRVNLWCYGEPVRGRGSRDAVAALCGGRTLLLLGRSVGRAFGLKGAPFLDHYELRNLDGEGFSVVLLPHPSGRNRWYNDPTNWVAASSVLRGVFRSINRSSRRRAETS